MPPRRRPPQPVYGRISDERDYLRDINRRYLQPIFRDLQAGVREAKTASQALAAVGNSRDLFPWSDDVLESIVGERVTQVEARHRARIQSTFSAALGVDIKPVLAEAEVQQWMTEWRQTNIGLIKTIPAEMHERLNSRMTTLFDRAPFDDHAVREMLGAEFRSTGYKARRITRDQMNKAVGNLTQIRHRQLGVREYIWTTVLDNRVRDTHAKQQGLRYRWDQPPPDTGHPGFDIQCRCVARPVLPKPPERPPPPPDDKQLVRDLKALYFDALGGKRDRLSYMTNRAQVLRKIDSISQPMKRMTDPEMSRLWTDLQVLAQKLPTRGTRKDADVILYQTTAGNLEARLWRVIQDTPGVLKDPPKPPPPKPPTPKPPTRIEIEQPARPSELPDLEAEGVKHFADPKPLSEVVGSRYEDLTTRTKASPNYFQRRDDPETSFLRPHWSSKPQTDYQRERMYESERWLFRDDHENGLPMLDQQQTIDMMDEMVRSATDYDQLPHDRYAVVFVRDDATHDELKAQVRQYFPDLPESRVEKAATSGIDIRADGSALAWQDPANQTLAFRVDKRFAWNYQDNHADIQTVIHEVSHLINAEKHGFGQTVRVGTHGNFYDVAGKRGKAAIGDFGDDLQKWHACQGHGATFCSVAHDGYITWAGKTRKQANSSIARYKVNNFDTLNADSVLTGAERVKAVTKEINKIKKQIEFDETMYRIGKQIGDEFDGLATDISTGRYSPFAPDIDMDELVRRLDWVLDEGGAFDQLHAVAGDVAEKTAISTTREMLTYLRRVASGERTEALQDEHMRLRAMWRGYRRSDPPYPGIADLDDLREIAHDMFDGVWGRFSAQVSGIQQRQLIPGQLGLDTLRATIDAALERVRQLSDQAAEVRKQPGIQIDPLRKLFDLVEPSRGKNLYDESISNRLRDQRLKKMQPLVEQLGDAEVTEAWAEMLSDIDRGDLAGFADTVKRFRTRLHGAEDPTISLTPRPAASAIPYPDMSALRLEPLVRQTADPEALRLFRAVQRLGKHAGKRESAYRRFQRRVATLYNYMESIGWTSRIDVFLAETTV